MVIFLIITAAGYMLAVILVIAATLLSAHISRSEPIGETYEASAIAQKGQGFTARTYPIEINS